MIVAIAGISKSGKSFLAQHLSEATGWPVLSFGSYVRHVASQNRKGSDFQTLQSLGQALVDEDPGAFVRSVFEHSGCSKQDNVILDGMRHVEVLDALHAYVSPEPVQLVLVQVDHRLLARRHQAVGQNLSDILAGPAEQQVQSNLAERALLVVDGGDSVQDAVDAALALINEK